jgi:beta-N-acetylhexosaminidase
VRLAALLQAVLAVTASPAPPDPVAGLSARQKAALVVVSGLPAPRGVAGVLVRRWDTGAPRPPGALVFVDQEGGEVRAFPGRPPERPAGAYESAGEALLAGRRTGRSLRAAGVHVDLAPVLDLSTGPLGLRHYASPRLALAFARGLEQGGVSACPKHFPGLGSAALSTDDAPRVDARLLRSELRAFRAAIRRGVRCVMIGHAFYEGFGGRALTAPAAYRLLSRLGFEGVAITDSLSVVRGPWTLRWARRGARSGADLLLFTSPRDAGRAIKALVPLARQGLLDEHVRRVLRLRRSLGLAGLPRW